MEREKLEESWKDAFRDAGITPSERVWVNIELELEKAKGGDLRRRLMFYQMLAAASVVFALAIGGVAYYSTTQNQQLHRTLALQNAAPTTPLATPDHQTPSDHDAAAVTETDLQPSHDRKARLSVSDRAASAPAKTDQIADAASVPSSGDEDGGTAVLRESVQLPLSVNDRYESRLYTPRKIELDMGRNNAETTVDPVVAMLARLDREERAMRGEDDQKDDKKSLGEQLWTSIGFAAGSFNTVQAPGAISTNQPVTMARAAAPIVDQETKASGYAYSMGINVGTRLSERWVLQGGVNYLTNSSEYTANNVVVTSAGRQQQRFTVATTNDIIQTEAKDLDSKIVYSAPYSVNNSMRYLSIPLQAGYLLIDRTFGLQLNAGVATDLFLQNTVTPDSENLEKTTQSGGADSPYRTFNLAGLLGTEFSYRFGEHYRVSLNPGIRYPFSTIYKSELGVQASPLTFDVGLRFRYIFH